jgi:uncharacterized protein YbjT (DUF2867 family)
MGKRLLLAGGSGEVGQRLLQKLIARNDVEQIHLVNRSHNKVASPKVIQHNIDFEHLNSLNLDLKFDIAYCCLGTTIKKAGSKTAFEKIDLHYVASFAQLAKRHQCDRLALISSAGATAKSKNFYLHTKGRMEDMLTAMPWSALWIVRPGLLTGKRREFRLSERLGGAVMRMLNPFLTGPLVNFRSIPLASVANGMSVLVGTPDSGTTILHNEQILKLA